jgi:hypothetical protein
MLHIVILSVVVVDAEERRLANVSPCLVVSEIGRVEELL